MKSWLLGRLKEYETTIAGIVLGGATGAALSIQNGQISKEALLLGAAVGIAGTLSKTPTWARVFRKK